MEGIYVHANRKSKNEDALYYGVIVFLDGGDYNAVSFNAYTWGPMIRLAEEKYGLKLHPKVYFCSESETIKAVHDSDCGKRSDWMHRYPLCEDCLAEEEAKASVIEMYCVPCNQKWKWHESDKDIHVMYCPTCKTIPRLPTKGGE